MNFRENYFEYAETEKVKNDSSPRYDQSFLVPFYCFDSIQIIFWKPKLFDKVSIASTDIQLNVEQFLKPHPITVPVKLYEPFNNANPSLTYSLSYLPIQQVPAINVSNPENIFAYLTYDPPLQLNTQDVRLFVKMVGENGSVFDPTNQSVILDKEATRYGPSGLTQVLYINHATINSANFFFYILATGYTGKITINFATAPTAIRPTNHNEYGMLNNTAYVDVNNEGQQFPVFALFPITLKLSQFSIEFNSKVIPLEISPKRSTAEANQPESEEIEKEIICSGFKLIHPDKEPHLRYEISLGRRYSIKEAGQRQGLTGRVNTLALMFSFDGSQKKDIRVQTALDGGESAKGYIIYNPIDSTEPIYFKNTYIPSTLDKVVDTMVIKLSQIKPEIKFLAVYMTFSQSQVSKQGVLARRTYKAGYCSIMDFESNKEIMGFPMESHVCPTHLLVLILHRNDNNEWDIMPMMNFYQQYSVYTSGAYTSVQTINMFREYVQTPEFQRYYNE